MFITDSEYDAVYPEKIKELSNIHWTPIEAARIAIEWLELDENSHLLDIGSGVGKFCCIAAEMTPAKITGVEKRKDLVRIANKVIKEKGLHSIQIIHSNITDVEFKDFNAFYYYNPFCEQLSINELIDGTIKFSRDKFRLYEDYVIDQMSLVPIGTKIVTFYSQEFTLPETYELKNLYLNSTLALWIKTK